MTLNGSAAWDRRRRGVRDETRIDLRATEDAEALVFDLA
jgi:hypothetical protein